MDSPAGHQCAGAADGTAAGAVVGVPADGPYGTCARAAPDGIGVRATSSAIVRRTVLSGLGLRTRPGSGCSMWRSRTGRWCRGRSTVGSPTLQRRPSSFVLGERQRRTASSRPGGKGSRHERACPPPPFGRGRPPDSLSHRPARPEAGDLPLGPPDGAWRPRWGDLMRELPSLTDLFDSTRGRVTRIAGSRRSWPGAPLLLPVTGHTVKAAWFVTGLDPFKIRLLSYGVGHWDLLVIPPATDPPRPPAHGCGHRPAALHHRERSHGRRGPPNRRRARRRVRTEL